MHCIVAKQSIQIKFRDSQAANYVVFRAVIEIHNM